MLDLQEHKKLDILYQQQKQCFYRSVNRSGQKIFIKEPLSETPSEEELIRIQHEYNITSALQQPGIKKPYDLIQNNKKISILYEDLGEITLSQYLKTHKPDGLFSIQVILKLAHILKGLHEEQINHRNLNPDTIWLSADKTEVLLHDFSCAELFSKNHSVKNIYIISSLAYLSPEQTGRINRQVDYRTDFYSLGLVFYQLLTGQHPFANQKEEDLIYSHIATRPESPKKLNPEIPDMIADIVLKLLEKDAANRYQSAFRFILPSRISVTSHS